MTRARPRRICCAALAVLPRRARAGRWRYADAGYFAGQLARAAHDTRIARLWRLGDIVEGDWTDAVEMDGAGPSG
jgi:hypothetical protein